MCGSHQEQQGELVFIIHMTQRTILPRIRIHLTILCRALHDSHGARAGRIMQKTGRNYWRAAAAVVFC